MVTFDGDYCRRLIFLLFDLIFLTFDRMAIDGTGEKIESIKAEDKVHSDISFIY